MSASQRGRYLMPQRLMHWTNRECCAGWGGGMKQVSVRGLSIFITWEMFLKSVQLFYTPRICTVSIHWVTFHECVCCSFIHLFSAGFSVFPISFLLCCVFKRMFFLFVLLFRISPFSVSSVVSTFFGWLVTLLPCFFHAVSTCWAFLISLNKIFLYVITHL